MFRMTANIKFEGYDAIKPSSFKWNRHLDNYSDTASITLPAMVRIKSKVEDGYTTIPTAEALKIGTKVTIECGYDYNNVKVFEGFINRINFKVPMVFDCEGYAWQLRKKYYKGLSFGNTTMKAVLAKLIEGTDIVMSSKMPEKIEFKAHVFDGGYSAIQILDWIKENYHCAVFFDFNELYVGWIATYKGDVVKHRLGWNVAKDDSLLFNTYTGATVHIEGVTKLPNGKKEKHKATNIKKAGDVKQVKVLSTNVTDKQAAVNDAQLRENRKGFSGSIVGFLVPNVVPGMSSVIIDKRYQQRNGRYFIEGVEGSFDKNGGRQNIKLSYALNDNEQNRGNTTTT